ncbi:Hypothetical protein PHPALM_20919 [Phytophthora palmivora]|uniref:Uncharacterized protein n=1 Tax=Phytophthora palmivora TaxID=4796 RepID=A0A2P4XDN9_9STRA|nr:Hypothetical protein PHPALM_20919 [Phytophthora palmivora]
MGARHSVVVEQLWMRGTVECQLTSSNKQLFKSERSVEDSGSVQKQPTREEVQEASSADKSSFQQLKINYILSNLRMLGGEMAGKDSEVRFSVLDESERTIRQGVHTISESGDVTTVSTMRTPSESVTSGTRVRPTHPQSCAVSTTGTSRRPKRKPTFAEVIVIDDSSSDEEHKKENDSEDEFRVPRQHFSRVKQESTNEDTGAVKAAQQTIRVKQEPIYIDEDTESE